MFYNIISLGFLIINVFSRCT